MILQKAIAVKVRPSRLLILNHRSIIVDIKDQKDRYW